MSEVSDVVTVGGAYKESDDHVPNPTDAFGTLDTSATAGAAHSAVEAVTPIFDVAKAQDSLVAAKALYPNDPTPASLVVLPEGMIIQESGIEGAKDRVKEAAQKYEEEPVVVGGPNPFQKEAAETTGEEGQKQAQAQQQGQADAAGSGSTGTDTARQQGGDDKDGPKTAAGTTERPQTGSRAKGNQ